MGFKKESMLNQIKHRGVILLILCIVSFDYCSLYAQKENTQTTVVLSLDGFRWDYPAKTSTPSLNRIAEEGVKAVSMIPSFPSKTFPNHYTMATGLYPNHNGMVNNAFYDPESGKPYSIGNKTARFDPDFYKGEPIWITARNQGVKTASFYWVGSDVAINGKHPDIWKDYNEEVPFINRIDTIIKWLSLPLSQRPRLIMAYYHEPDEAGHAYGPDDIRTLTVVHEVDSMVGILYSRIKQLPDGNNINFIVVSDHGMGAISSIRNIALREYIPETWPVRIEGGNPNYNLYADASWSDSAYFSLKKAKGIKVWRPFEVPGYLHYGSNLRVGDIIVVADSSWSVTLNRPKKEFTGGTHGYDIHNTDIHAIFYAVGPAFKHGYVQTSFQNTHIYVLLARLLGVKPAQTDGDIQQVIEMLNH